MLDKHIIVQELIMVTCLQNSDGHFKQFVTLLWSKPFLYTFLQVKNMVIMVYCNGLSPQCHYHNAGESKC